MKQEVLKHWDLPWLPLTALIIFVVCFLAYVFWTFRRVNADSYESASQIPLKDAHKVESNSKGTSNEK